LKNIHNWLRHWTHSTNIKGMFATPKSKIHFNCFQSAKRFFQNELGAHIGTPGANSNYLCFVSFQNHIQHSLCRFFCFFCLFDNWCLNVDGDNWLTCFYRKNDSTGCHSDAEINIFRSHIGTSAELQMSRVGIFAEHYLPVFETLHNFICQCWNLWFFCNLYFYFYKRNELQRHNFYMIIYT
jgi:hypothetical protein